jgi:hypothetical protein
MAFELVLKFVLCHELPLRNESRLFSYFRTQIAVQFDPHYIQRLAFDCLRVRYLSHHERAIDGNSGDFYHFEETH